MIVVADAGPIHYLVLVLGSPLSSARRTTALFRLIGTCLPPSSVAFPPNDRRKLAPDPTKERVAEDSDAEHCGEQRQRFETFAPFPLPVHVTEIEPQRELIQRERGAHSIDRKSTRLNSSHLG